MRFTSLRLPWKPSTTHPAADAKFLFAFQQNWGVGGVPVIPVAMFFFLLSAIFGRVGGVTLHSPLHETLFAFLDNPSPTH